MTYPSAVRSARVVTAFGSQRFPSASAQAATALGPNGQIDVAADNGALVWRVIGGDGWKAGEPITFYWQSTQPPAGSTDAYLVETDGSVAIGSGPFPAKEKPVDEPARR